MKHLWSDLGGIVAVWGPAFLAGAIIGAALVLLVSCKTTERSPLPLPDPYNMPWQSPFYPPYPPYPFPWTPR